MRARNEAHSYNLPMSARQPTLDRLSIARQLLLTPYGLDESHLTQALAAIRAHRVHEADLYFQYTRAEGWSLEEGIVKTYGGLALAPRATFWETGGRTTAWPAWRAMRVLGQLAPTELGGPSWPNRPQSP